MGIESMGRIVSTINILILIFTIVAIFLVIFWLYKIMRLSESNNKNLKEIIIHLTKEDFHNKH